MSVYGLFNDAVWNSEQICSGDYVINSKENGRGVI